MQFLAEGFLGAFGAVGAEAQGFKQVAYAEVIHQDPQIGGGVAAAAEFVQAVVDQGAFFLGGGQVVANAFVDQAVEGLFRVVAVNKVLADLAVAFHQGNAIAAAFHPGGDGSRIMLQSGAVKNVLGDEPPVQAAHIGAFQLGQLGDVRQGGLPDIQFRHRLHQTNAGFGLLLVVAVQQAVDTVVGVQQLGQGAVVVQGGDDIRDILAHIRLNEPGSSLEFGGAVGQIGGLNVYESVNLGAYEVEEDGTTYTVEPQIIAGHPNCATRVEEWAVGVHVQDLAQSGKYIGACAVQGRKVFTHKVTNKDGIFVYATKTAKA